MFGRASYIGVVRTVIRVGGTEADVNTFKKLQDNYGRPIPNTGRQHNTSRHQHHQTRAVMRRDRLTAIIRYTESVSLYTNETPFFFSLNLEDMGGRDQTLFAQKRGNQGKQRVGGQTKRFIS